MGYRIKTVARLTGVPRNTLLAWERRYNLVEPDRADNGYREYTEEDVQRIIKIKRLVDRGYKISEAITLASQGGAEVAALASGPALGGSALEDVQVSLCTALLRFDRPEATRIVEQLPVMGFETQLDELYLPTLTEVGELWEEGEISVAQEHFASAFCRERMVGMLAALGHGPDTGELVVCAGVAGERHEGGLLSVAVRLALRGARVSYLGPDVPADALISACRDRLPAMVCVSATGPRDLAELLSYVRAVRRGLPAEVRLSIGGGAIERLQPGAEPGVEWHTSPQSLFGAPSTAAAR
ncbi:MAG: MerR family transcriptional regulator [Deltaproteobacteria bacterium]|jgi:DNA-binding transcriptional MerR regulator|nr:MerR family transcriptional regulator [Deltaproteobacteria bacterium]